VAPRAIHVLILPRRSLTARCAPHSRTSRFSRSAASVRRSSSCSSSGRFPPFRCVVQLGMQSSDLPAQGSG
jgi:hypothetical protein